MQNYIITAPNYSIKGFDAPSYWTVTRASWNKWSQTVELEISGSLSKENTINQVSILEKKGWVVDVSTSIIDGNFVLQMTQLAIEVFPELAGATYELYVPETPAE